MFEPPPVEARGLTKAYGRGLGLSDLRLTVQRGEVVAVVGHNGAGKSTLLKLLAGWIRPDRGDAAVAGVPIANRRAVARKLGFVAETPNLYEQFSVDYNLCLFARLFAVGRARVDEVVAAFNLAKVRGRKVQTLSKGMRQRVSLARCLLADPEVLLLDEPTSGLDFDATRELFRHLAALHAAGKTILFTSHRPEDVRQLATRIVVLHGGAAVFDGSPADYFASSAHQELYR